MEVMEKVCKGIPYAHLFGVSLPSFGQNESSACGSTGLEALHQHKTADANRRSTPVGAEVKGASVATPMRDEHRSATKETLVSPRSVL